MPELTADEYQAVCEIVDRATELPVTERLSFLKLECGANAGLLHHAQRMLANFGAIERRRFLSSTAPVSLKTHDNLPAGDLVGQQIGKYLIQKLVATGGMGQVYQAVRADDFRKTVALKVVRSELRSAVLLSRFEMERQILANLQHPAIASLIDGGATTDGRPYLVMEFISGEAITKYCDRQRLSIEQRITIFTAAAAGVQYAHQQSVLHRDLKPSNVLVTVDGAPKIVDFGIAKLVQPESVGGSNAETRREDQLYSRDYASPEQFRAQPVSTATDVYSLGVVLYELLTGSLPYDLRDLSAAQAEQRVCESAIERPSHAVAHQRALIKHESDPNAKATLAVLTRKERELRGDLDNIVMMALRKEPERRYQTVDRFITDLTRFLKGMPVTAAKDTRWYRTSKFVRRNRFGVAGSALFLVVLLSGLVVTSLALVRAVRAERSAKTHFDEVRSLATQSVFDFHDLIAGLPGSTAAREKIVTVGLEYLDKLSQEEASDDSLRLELCKAYLRGGDAAGSPYRSSLGRYDLAMKAYQKAEFIANDLHQRVPDNSDYLLQLLTARTSTADVLGATQKVSEARDLQFAVSQKVEEALNRMNGGRDWELARVESLLHLVGFDVLLGNLVDAGHEADEANALAKSLAKNWPNDLECLRRLYRSYLALGTVNLETGNSKNATLNMQQAINTATALRQKKLGDTSDTLILGGMYLNLADCYRRVYRFDLSAQALENGRVTLAPVAAADPQNNRAQFSLAHAEIEYARYEVLKEQYAEAVRLCNQAIERLNAFESAAGGELYVQRSAALSALGDCHAQLNQPREAEASFSESLKIALQLLQSSAKSDDYLAAARAYLRLATFYRDQKRYDDALQSLQREDDLLAKGKATASTDWQFLNEQAAHRLMCAKVYFQLQNLDEAAKNAREFMNYALPTATKDPDNFRQQGLALEGYRLSARIAASLAKNADDPHLAEAKRLCNAEIQLWRSLIDKSRIPPNEATFANEQVASAEAFLRDLDNANAH